MLSTSRPSLRAAVGATALAVALATLSPLTPARSDDGSAPQGAGDAQASSQVRGGVRSDRTWHRPDSVVSVDPQARRGALAAAPKVKGWQAPKTVVTSYKGFQSYDIARNAKGQSVVVWSELARGNSVQVRYARLSPSNKVVKRGKLTGRITRSTADGGIVGQVAAAMDGQGRATLVWSQRTGEATGVRSASITPAGKVTQRWVTQQGHPPMSVFAQASATGHVVVWWNGYDPEAWGSPQQYVRWKGRKAWKKVAYTLDPEWMPDEGGSASVANSGLVSATWVERGRGKGRLRAVTMDTSGKIVEKVVASAGSEIMNSSHDTTAKGDLAVSFMDYVYVGDERRTVWYSLRRTKGRWGSPAQVRQPQPYGNTWDIDVNDAGKAVMIGLGYNADISSVAVTAGVQQKRGAAWTVSEAGPRVENAFSYFTPVVHLTANGRALTSYSGAKSAGVAWTRRGKNGAWVRAAVRSAGDLKFASDARSRVNMLTLASSSAWTLAVYQNDL